MFALFVNDFIPEIIYLGCAIPLESDNEISTLLLADDIVIIASTADVLQSQLDRLNLWFKKLQLNVKIDKTKIFEMFEKQLYISLRITL